jgi:hypothetical protein
MANIKTKPSYQQGDLDMLCGVYSLLNIIQLLRPQSIVKSQKLFFKVLRHLEKNKAKTLSKTITTGLTFKDMKQLFNVFLSAENLCWQLPFHGRDKPDVDQYWNTLTDLLMQHKESCIFIRLTGIHNHWTIVKAISENTLTLYDSDKLLRIHRRSCCIKSVNNKPHLLWPTHTVFIYKHDQDGHEAANSV